MVGGNQIFDLTPHMQNRASWMLLRSSVFNSARCSEVVTRCNDSPAMRPTSGGISGDSATGCDANVS